MLWDDVIGPGGDSSRVLPRGAVVRLTDVEGDACANLLVYNAAQPLERLNVADTVKVQWQAYLGAGLAAALRHGPRAAVDRRRHRAAHHDALCGASNARCATRRSTATAACTATTRTPATASRWRWPSTGSARRDIVPNVNLFKGVTRRAPTARCTFVGDGSHAGCRTSSCAPSCR